MIEICNLRNEKPQHRYDIKVDRSSVLGNPFNMTSVANRDQVCNRYYDWFYQQIKEDNIPFDEELNRLMSLYIKYKKLRLFCWCAPLRCHSETIKEWIEMTSWLQHKP
jgi:hypothetical protein